MRRNILTVILLALFICMGVNVQYSGNAFSWLTVTGDTTITNAGGDSNSYKLILEAHMTAGDETQTSSVFTAWGLNPYLVVATPSATGVETNTLHITPTVFSFATDNQTDIGATGATRPKNIYLAGNIVAEAGNITANGNLIATTGSVAANTTITGVGDITSTTGNIVASTGFMSANTTISAGAVVTGGTGVTATTGNVTAAAGSAVDQYANVRVLRPIVATGTPAEPFDCTAEVYGWMIPIVDTDAGADWLCWCGKLDNVPNYEWRKVSDEGSCFP